MDKTASDLLNGFVKRAQQHGLNNEETTHLVKKANPELMELWNMLKSMGNKHIVEPISHIPENAKGYGSYMKDSFNTGMDYGRSHGGLPNPEEFQRDAQQVEARHPNFKTQRNELLKGLGVAGAGAGVAGLGAYGAGKAMFGNNQPSQAPQMPQPNMPQQLQQ